MRSFLSAVLVLGLAGGAWGDTVHLKDGTSVEGNLSKNDTGWTITRPDGQTVQVPSGQVQSVEIKRASHGPDEAQSALNSLRRAADHLDNLDDIISRYQRFLKANPDTPAAADAKKDLAQWQSRRAQGMVKYAQKWVTPQQREQLAARSLADVSEARQLLKQGQLKETGQRLDAILAANPQNAAALYLQGVLLFRQDKSVPARKDFLAVNDLVPNHAPTLNNLGVIYGRQKQPVGALKYFNEAMRSDPQNKSVLDNTAEALHALTPDEQRTAIARQTAERFKAQDAELTRTLSKEGWHRWGATWVDDKQYEQLKEAEKQVQKQLDALAGQYQGIQDRIRQIDDQISANNRSLNSISASAYLPDPNGNWVYIGLPSIYYDLQNSNKKLQAERAGEVSHLQQLRGQAQQVEKQLPVPKYTGRQHLIGVEGTPLGDAVLPATRASPPPAQGTLRPSTATQPIKAAK
jgi:Flp pilus assembly protein TadD